MRIRNTVWVDGAPFAEKCTRFVGALFMSQAENRFEKG
ncbi:hypothetical protein ARMA_2566 [Ardenticatena maritima]|uniref:Uncharacterized protein n=1 Tax=Ardenticatena maritima TaxID=872965 RepID=A0A0M8K8S7_9CHLR|nr:hypothetical protein ARMA_2566 [Ardenticatena maritima]